MFIPLGKQGLKSELEDTFTVIHISQIKESDFKEKSKIFKSYCWYEISHTDVLENQIKVKYHINSEDFSTIKRQYKRIKRKFKTFNDEHQNKPKKNSKKNKLIENYLVVFNKEIDEKLRQVNLPDTLKSDLKNFLFEENKDYVIPPVLIDGYGEKSIEEYFEIHITNNLTKSERENLIKNHNLYLSIKKRVFCTLQIKDMNTEGLPESLFFHFDYDGIKMYRFKYHNNDDGIYDFSVNGFRKLSQDLFKYSIEENEWYYDYTDESEYIRKLKNNISTLPPDPFETNKSCSQYWGIFDFLEKIRTDETSRVNNKINLFLEELKKSQSEELSIFDENNEFDKLLGKNESLIIEKNEKYLHNFVRLKRYINNKKLNIISIIDILKKTSYEKDFELTKGIIENEIHLYKSVFTYSIVMLLSLKNNKMITFFDIYETLDNLKIFNTNWENEVSQDLKKLDESIIENGKMIQEKFDQVIKSIYDVGEQITESIGILSSEINSSIKEINNSLTQELNSINSSVKINNLLTGIQTYQMYKINKNTKSLRS